MNLTLNCVTNLGSRLYNGQGSNYIDTHRNLRIVGCRSGERMILLENHGFKVYNGLFLRNKSGGNLMWSQCDGDMVECRNVTFDDCVCGAAAFSSNVAGNPHYYYNCVIGRFWTTDAKTARQTIMSQSGAKVYYSCLPVENPGSGTLDANTILADPKLKTGGYLKCSSPCLRTGNPAYCTAYDTDIEGKPRFHTVGETTTVDLGCYENSISGLMLLVK